MSDNLEPRSRKEMAQALRCDLINENTRIILKSEYMLGLKTRLQLKGAEGARDLKEVTDLMNQNAYDVKENCSFIDYLDKVIAKETEKEAESK